MAFLDISRRGQPHWHLNILAIVNIRINRNEPKEKKEREVIRTAHKKVGKIERKKGMMYFVDGQGNVMETKMNRKGKKKKK